MSTIEISVVIPTRHRDEDLARCLEQLAPGKQSLAASLYEVIVSDDGCRTTSQQMVETRFPWARWVRGPQRGPAANRNNGVKHTSGRMVAFVDDDCLPDAGWLAAFRNVFNGDVPIYEGKTTCTAGLKSPMDEAPVNLTGGNLWSCNLCVRRDVFDTLGGFDESYWMNCEDVDFHGRVNHKGLRKMFVESAVVEHPPRRRATSIVEARRWESRALLWFKQGNLTPLWRWMPVHIAKVRIHQLTQFPISLDWVQFAGASVIEWFYVLAHLRQWQAKHSTVTPTRPLP